MDEMQEAEKRLRWIWFVLPRLKGFGHSYRPLCYGIVEANESRVYLIHSSTERMAARDYE
ncbi:DUF1810 family protein [Prevotella scopos JCM 17725]|nr:DUF1810 family protein [Prevotella scopos JCM 17725]